MRTITAGLIVMPDSDFIHGEMATHVMLDSEGAGAFVVVTQPGGHVEKHGISINPEEWPSIRRAIDRMMRVARDAEARG